MAIDAKVDTYIWSEKYRPTKVNDVIIPDSYKVMFNKFIEDKQIPNMLLSSPSPGTGKTSIALALCDELDINPLFINASLESGIDTIRTKVIGYATTMGVMGNNAHKVIILDESSDLSIAAQDSLRGILDQVHKRCRFIFTTNSKSRMSEKLVSRCTADIDFSFNEEEKNQIQVKMFKRCSEILRLENVEFNPKVLAQIVQKYNPDNRRTLQALQRYYIEFGAINEAALGHMASGDTEILVAAMKAKKFNDVKAWVYENSDRLSDDFYGKLFKSLEQKLSSQSIPESILIIGRYQTYHSTVPDRQLNYLAMLTELMMTVGFK